MPASEYFRIRRKNRRVPEDAIRLGTTPRGEVVWISREELATHVHLMGPTGSGKSKLLELIGRDCIRSGEEALVVLDPNHDLMRDIIDYVHATRQTHRLLILDAAHQQERIMGFNPLSVCSGDIATESWRDTQAILHTFGAIELMSTPRLFRWLYNVIFALRSNSITLAEATELLRPVPTSAGFAIARAIGLPDVRGEWDAINEETPSRRLEQLESTYSRMRAIFNNPAMRRLFGQQTNLLNLEDAIAEKKIVCVNLQQGPSFTDLDANFLGTLMLSQLLRVNIHREKEDRLPCVVIADEFWRINCDEATDVLSTGRKYLTKLILAHQTPEQLVNRVTGDKQLLSLVETCCRTTILFGDMMPATYRPYAEKIATRSFDPYRVKQEIHHTTQLHAGWEKRTTHSWASQSGGTSSLSDARPYEDGDFLEDRTDLERGTTTSVSADTWNEGASTSETFLPLYKNVEQLSSREFVSFEEHQLAVTQQLVNMHDQHATIMRKAMPEQFFKVCTVRPVRISAAARVQNDNAVLMCPGNPYNDAEAIDVELVDRLSRLSCSSVEEPEQLELELDQIGGPAGDPASPADVAAVKLKQPKKKTKKR